MPIKFSNRTGTAKTTTIQMKGGWMMRRTFWLYSVLFSVVASLFLVTALPVLFAPGVPEELAEGATWRYVVKLNGQLFGIDITVLTG